MKLIFVLFITFQLLFGKSNSLQIVNLNPTIDFKNITKSIPVGCINPLNCRSEIITTPSPLTKETIRQLRPCFDSEIIMELCQRCAKETRATNVFPLCCSNVDDVKEYCENYIYFGIR